MISFYDLSSNLRALFIGFAFTELCMSIVLLQPAIKRKNTMMVIVHQHLKVLKQPATRMVLLTVNIAQHVAIS